MKKFTITLILAALLSFFMQIELFASETDKEMAVSLVKKTIALINENGIEKVCEMVNNKDSEVINGEKYIFINNYDNVSLAHGANVKLVGRDFSKLKDANGVFFMVEMGKVAQEQGSGWIEYRWSNPAVNKVQNKVTYVEKIEGEDLYVACGFYEE